MLFSSVPVMRSTDRVIGYNDHKDARNVFHDAVIHYEPFDGICICDK